MAGLAVILGFDITLAIALSINILRSAYSLPLVEMIFAKISRLDAGFSTLR